LVSDYVAYRPWFAGPTTPECDLLLSVPSVQVSADATPDAVELVWTGPGLAGQELRVQRGNTEGQWFDLATLSVVIDRVEYRDTAVRPGERHGYRLLVAGQGGSFEARGEVWVTVPREARLAWLGASPNPARINPRLAFVLANDHPALLEVFDVAGRRVRAMDLTNVGPGRHVIDAGAGPALHPGVYRVRLRQDNRSVHGSFVLIR
jgi:hypothetical protein